MLPLYFPGIEIVIIFQSDRRESTRERPLFESSAATSGPVFLGTAASGRPVASVGVIGVAERRQERLPRLLRSQFCVVSSCSS